jgi:hypothetical protein
MSRPLSFLYFVSTPNLAVYPCNSGIFGAQDSLLFAGDTDFEDSSAFLFEDFHGPAKPGETSDSMSAPGIEVAPLSPVSVARALQPCPKDKSSKRSEPRPWWYPPTTGHLPATFQGQFSAQGSSVVSGYSVSVSGSREYREDHSGKSGDRDNTQQAGRTSSLEDSHDKGTPSLAIFRSQVLLLGNYPGEIRERKQATAEVDHRYHVGHNGDQMLMLGL